jgi:hypothetical protein
MPSRLARVWLSHPLCLQAYQKIPRKKVIDRRDGTIEKDAEFLAFMEEFEEQRSFKIESAEAWYTHA